MKKSMGGNRAELRTVQSTFQGVASWAMHVVSIEKSRFGLRFPMMSSFLLRTLFLRWAGIIQQISTTGIDRHLSRNKPAIPFISNNAEPLAKTQLAVCFHRPDPTLDRLSFRKSRSRLSLVAAVGRESVRERRRVYVCHSHCLFLRKMFE